MFYSVKALFAGPCVLRDVRPFLFSSLYVDFVGNSSEEDKFKI